VRRRLSILVAASTSAVVLAFLIPLALLLRVSAEERAFARADAQTRTVLLVAANQTDRKVISDLVGGLIRGFTGGRTTLWLPAPDNTPIGPDQSNPEPFDPKVEELRARATTERATTGDGGAVVWVASPGLSGTLVARTVIPRSQFHNGVAAATAILAGLGMGLLLIAMFAADRVGRRVSAPIRDLALAANAMRDGHLDVRVSERGAPEVVALGTALNQLAARVQQLLKAERDSVADLSHRLRTPVTALRLDTEGVGDPELAERLRQHVDMLQRTIDVIVHDARSGSRAGGKSCDVCKVVRDRVAYWSALAEDQGRTMEHRVEDRPLWARLDAAELSDVVDVLIDNVFAHTEEGVSLEVWVVSRADGAVVLTVEDGGQGLPQTDIIARGSSGAGSTGLGMDIVRRAAKASGGGMEVGRSRLGGALIRVVLGAADR
jgi:signal transduction histidine kinase